MKMRELFSPIPKKIFKNDDVRERVEIFLVLFVVASLGYKFVKGSINDYHSLDDPILEINSIIEHSKYVGKAVFTMAIR